jgi:hypothetical protein
MRKWPRHIKGRLMMIPILIGNARYSQRLRYPQQRLDNKIRQGYRIRQLQTLEKLFYSNNLWLYFLCCKLQSTISS